MFGTKPSGTVIAKRPFENPFAGGFGRDSSWDVNPSDAWPDGRN